MQDLEAAQNHARDWTYNWGLKQTSNLAQQMTPVVDQMHQPATRPRLLDEFNERKNMSSIGFKQDMGAHRKNASHLESDFRTQDRIAPVAHMHYASPRGSLSKTNILLQPENYKASARFSFHRNEGSRVSMSIHSDYKRQIS